MSSSSVNESVSIPCGPNMSNGPYYQNVCCNCPKKRAAVKISKTDTSKNLLYYSCRDRRCRFFAWTYPTGQPPSTNVRNGLGLPTTELQQPQSNDEVRGLKTKLKWMEKSIDSLKSMMQLMMAIFVVCITVMILKK